MKKEFYVLMSVVILTAGLGMLPGCSAESDGSKEGAAMSEDSGEEIREADIQEIESIIEEFSAVYFSGDADTVQKYLTNPFEWDIDTYEGPGTVDDFIIKGLPAAGERSDKNKWYISLEFLDSKEDSNTYLTCCFVKQEGRWKINFYGLEK